MTKRRIAINDLNADTVRDLTTEDIQKITGGALSFLDTSTARVTPAAPVRTKADWVYITVSPKT